METVTKRKTSLTLDADALDAAREFGVNVSAVAEEALRHAVADARRRCWVEENLEAFTAQAEWHERNGHPLADIMAGPAHITWSN